MRHPTLYKRGAAAGVMLQWRVWTHNNVLFTEHGQVGGKLQTSPGNVKKGKNIGRANATTPESQAQVEALAAWQKRIKRGGYRETVEEALGYLHSVPMLAHKYPEHLKAGKVTFPAYIQPKLDGLRSPGYLKRSGPVLQSRKLTHYTAPDHILQELEYVLDGDVILEPDAVLDGELYCHGIALSEISSAAKKYHKGETERLKLFVYDCTRQSEQGQTQSNRLRTLNKFFHENQELQHIVQVPTFVVENEADVWKHYTQFVAEGFEGAIIRTADHTYEFDTRSHGLLKLKAFVEEEFRIIAVTAGSGKAAHWPVFTCANPNATRDPKEFDVLPKGPDEAKRAMLARGDELIGQQLMVRFHQWTKYGQPEHPRGISIREDV